MSTPNCTEYMNDRAVSFDTIFCILGILMPWKHLLVL